ncbi:MAG: hypothetical protein KDI82_16200 [Gammaproteobacteria bacterium]|nr:hypothetical protein [Gammaproteobacteria bacterium]
MKKSFDQPGAGGWAGPIGATLQACSPRQRRRLRIVQVNLVLLSLMQDLQQHRGLSGAVLDRQDAFRDERIAVAAKLQRSLIAIGDQYGDRHAVFRSDEWQALLVRWQALSANWHDLDFATNLTAHRELVLSVVAIVQTLALQHMNCLGERRTRIATEWTPLVEHLGMLRALGLHRLGTRPDIDDDRLPGVFRHHLHELRSVLASVAAEVGDELPLMDRSARLVEVIVALRDGTSRQTPASYLQLTTRHIDDWYAAIRRGLHGD